MLSNPSIQIQDDITGGVFATEPFDSDPNEGVTPNQIVVRTTGSQAGGYETYVGVVTFDPSGNPVISGESSIASSDYEEAYRIHWRSLNGLNPTNSAEYIHVPHGTEVKKISYEDISNSLKDKKQTSIANQERRITVEKPQVQTESQKTEEPLPPDAQDNAVAEEPRNESEPHVSDKTSFSNQLARNVTEQPSSESPSSEGSWADKLEEDIVADFRPGLEGVKTLKSDLEDYVDQGGSPFLAALGATALDISAGAMGFAQGVPLSFLDVRNVGEGITKGTWAGVKEDAQRVLSVIPQGRILRAIDDGLTAYDVVEALKQEDYVGAAVQGGIGTASRLPKSARTLDRPTTSPQNFTNSGGKLRENKTKGKTQKGSNASRSTAPGQLVRNSSNQLVKRVRSSTLRSRFRRRLIRHLADNPGHPLAFLGRRNANGNIVGLHRRPRGEIWESERNFTHAVEAGHQTSRHLVVRTGEPELFGVQSRFHNQYDNRVMESGRRAAAGNVFYDVKGIPVEGRTLRDYLDEGLITRDVYDRAISGGPVQGWNLY